MTKETEVRVTVEFDRKLFDKFMLTAHKLMVAKDLKLKLTKKQALVMAVEESIEKWETELGGK